MSRQTTLPLRRGSTRRARRNPAGHLPPLVTTNFASLKRLPPTIEPIAISRGVPVWFKGRREIRLAPTRAMLKMPREEYNPLFFQILNRLDPWDLYSDLIDGGTSDGRQVALLCWCKPDYCCHRRYVAEWFEAHIGAEKGGSRIIVPEWGFERATTQTFLESE